MNNFIKILIFFLCISFPIASASFLRDIKDGIALYDKGNYTVAQDYFKSYISATPNDEDGYYWLAKTYQKSSMPDKELLARQNFDKAYQIILEKRNLEKVFFNPLGTINLEDYFDIATTYFEAGKYDKSEEYANLMLKIDPKSSLAYFVKSKVAYTKGDNQKAKELLEHAIMYNNDIIKTNLAAMLKINRVPDYTKDVYYYKGIERFLNGDIEEAKKYLKNYVFLDGNDVAVRNFLVDLAFKTDDIQLAQKNIYEISKINPNNIQNLVNQAKVYKITNEKEKIEPILLKAYKINPNNKELLVEFSNYYLDKKDYLNSKKFFEILLSIDDEFYEAYFGYIYSLIQLKDFDNALIQIRKISALNPTSGEIPYLLAKMSIMEAQYSQATDYLFEAIEKEENPIYYFELAKLNYLLGNYYKSIINLNGLLGSFNVKNRAEIYGYLAKNYLKLEDRENTTNILNKKNALDKNEIIYKYILYRLYKLEGNEKEASIYLAQLKRIKPLTEIDYLNLAEFYFEEFNIDTAIRLLDEGEKKFPNSTEFYCEKLKLYYLAQNKEKLEETLKRKS